MWKESYRLGVDSIDRQHMELFGMVEKLLDVVQNGKGDNKRECMSAISYLKEYTLQHFSDEEAFQKSIGYSGLREHRIIHQKFVQDVLNHERKMIVSNFHSKDIKEFMGTLISWLVYHVAGADQMIVAHKQDELQVEKHSPIDSYFHVSTCDIINKLTGMDIKNIKIINQAIGDLQSTIIVRVNIVGDVSGTVTYKYTKQLAFDLIKSMTSVLPASIDELVCSAMLEISNIISVKAVGMMSSIGYSCNTNLPVMHVEPAFLPSKQSIIFDTGMGILDMDVAIG